MKKYFDEYFDMIYFLNLPNRTDRYENVMNMFNKLNIEKYTHIIPIEAKTLEGDYTLSKTAMSCKLAHLSIYEDVIKNNYKQVMIFEDDFCFNTEDENIEKNIEYHLEVAFTFLKRAKWNIFYFDNMLDAYRLDDDTMVGYRRMPSNHKIESIKGKRFTQSYAISYDACKTMVDVIGRSPNGTTNHVDKDLQESGIPFIYMYSKGIFDQLLFEKADNNWFNKLVIPKPEQLRNVEYTEGLIDLINTLDKPENFEMVEIGTYVGDSAKIFIDNIPTLTKINCIDPWENYDRLVKCPMVIVENYFNEFKKQYPDKINKIKSKSIDAVKYFDDDSLDFVYIDGNHTYEGCKSDIELYLPKIKDGGWIGGHDYQNNFPGVLKSVNEVFGKENILTFKDTSWLIQVNKKALN